MHDKHISYRKQREKNKACFSIRHTFACKLLEYEEKTIYFFILLGMHCVEQVVAICLSEFIVILCTFWIIILFFCEKNKVYSLLQITDHLKLQLFVNLHMYYMAFLAILWRSSSYSFLLICTCLEACLYLISIFHATLFIYIHFMYVSMCVICSNEVAVEENIGQLFKNKIW